MLRILLFSIVLFSLELASNAQTTAREIQIQNGQFPGQNLQPFNDITTASSSSYTLDSTRFDLFNEVNGRLIGRRTSVYETVNDSTQKIQHRSWGFFAHRPENNYNSIEIVTDQRRYEESFIPGTNQNFKAVEYLLDTAQQDMRFTYLIYDTAGNLIDSTYSLLDSTYLNSNTLSEQGWKTDAAFNPIAFNSLEITTKDHRDREVFASWAVPTNNPSDPFEARLVKLDTTRYVDGAGEDYSYIKTEVGLAGELTVTATGSYTHFPDSIYNEYNRTLEGDTAPYYFGKRFVSLNADGHVKEVVTEITRSGNTNPSRITYSYIPGTDIITKVDRYRWGIKTSEVRYFYQGQTSALNEVVASDCALQTSNVGPESFRVAGAPFTGTFQILDVQGRVLQTATRNQGESLNFQVPEVRGLYYLVGQSASEHCITKLVR